MAYLAVNEILSYATTNTADPAICAMIYAFISVVVPELANSTIIPSGPYTTTGTNVGSWLSRAT
jgi:hypothetical protein